MNFLKKSQIHLTPLLLCVKMAVDQGQAHRLIHAGSVRWNHRLVSDVWRKYTVEEGDTLSVGCTDIEITKNILTALKHFVD